jgi:hypothetical protein
MAISGVEGDLLGEDLPVAGGDRRPGIVIEALS